MIESNIFRVATFNVRFDNNDVPTTSVNKVSSIVTQGETPWQVRRVKVADTILFHRIDLVGLQEALYNQIKDLELLLGSSWGWIGVGRDDGKKSGEFNPDIPGSIGWDAALTRVVTQARFQDLLTNTTFVWINTHFDHLGTKARLESSKLLLNHARKLASSSSPTLKVFLSGDFNCEESAEPYKLLTGVKHQDIKSKDQESITNLSTMIFADTRYEINGLKGGSFGFSKTFTGFSKDTKQERIDFILVDNISISTRAVGVISHGVVSNLYDEMYISDHRPVISDLLIR
ncbi:11490_t:CDS:2 [Funneliformis geosporum]|uniref:3413_t:CDS:1 n=1 Tax=Funneliformis geosporum TaxID=1117311 RepID=A0A9W4SH90_9GLOM|nr:11490_t:CDS:2 [Funneliformis geosporum]CAI2169380.1 3413_t:CDS:2 [Funneliformis geosporum]